MEQGIEHLPDASRGGQGRDVGPVNLFAGGLASCRCHCPMQAAPANQLSKPRRENYNPNKVMMGFVSSALWWH